MRSTKIEFEGSEGQSLIGFVDLPLDEMPHNMALFAHCFTCSKNLLAVKRISQALVDEGYGVLRFDFTGLGESSGEFADTNFGSNISDLLCAADYLEEHFSAASLLVGHSLGGAAVVHAAASLPSVKAIATIGSPFQPEHVLHLIEGSRSNIEESGEAEVNIGGRNFKIRKQFIEDLENRKSEDLVRNMKKALLILHSPQDTIVSIKNAAALYNAAWHPKSFISLDGADHLLSRSMDANYVGEVLGSWAKRYLDLPKEPVLKSKKQVLVRSTDNPFTAWIKAGRHLLKADEPEEFGGHDAGPNPYDLLLASLGACTSMTLKMYAARKGWDLGEVEVHLEHSKEYLDDLEHMEESQAKIDLIRREIAFSAELTEEQRVRLIEIADKCPVHRSLHSELQVQSSLL